MKTRQRTRSETNKTDKRNIGYFFVASIVVFRSATLNGLVGADDDELEADDVLLLGVVAGDDPDDVDEIELVPVFVRLRGGDEIDRTLLLTGAPTPLPAEPGREAGRPTRST